MEFLTLNGRTSGSGSSTQRPEKVDVMVTNSQGASITLGYPVSLTTTAASVDGMQGVLPATTNLRSFYGIALRTIPNNGVDLVRSWGWCNSVAIFAHGTSVTIAADVAMGPGPASLGVSSTGLVQAFGPVISMEAIGAAICSPGGYARGFVRGM